MFQIFSSNIWKQNNKLNVSSVSGLRSNTSWNIWGHIWKNKNHDREKRRAFGAVDSGMRFDQLPERIGYASPVEAVDRYEHPTEEDQQRVWHLQRRKSSSSSVHHGYVKEKCQLKMI